MFLSAFTTDECAKGNIAVGALVALAIDAEGIELVFRDLLLEEVGGVWSLRVSGRSILAFGVWLPWLFDFWLGLALFDHLYEFNEL